MKQLQQNIENAWDDRSLLTNQVTINSIRSVIDLLDEGTLRVAEPTDNGWQVNEWVKRLYYISQFKKWKP
jgi:2,3,4,5-tetrahydropyridine-2-carboxylate N-succinyltransferase